MRKKKEKHEDQWQVSIGFRIDKAYDYVVRKIAKQEEKYPSDVWRRIVKDHKVFKGVKEDD